MQWNCSPGLAVLHIARAREVHELATSQLRELLSCNFQHHVGLELKTLLFPLLSQCYCSLRCDRWHSPTWVVDCPKDRWKSALFYTNLTLAQNLWSWLTHRHICSLNGGIFSWRKWENNEETALLMIVGASHKFSHVCFSCCAVYSYSSLI